MKLTDSNPFTGWWIWTSAGLPERNRFVRFRRKFKYNGGLATMHITADSRYAMYINGQYVGQGPVRAWPNHWRYDTYDIKPFLYKGDNVVCIIVNHYNESNFQYIHAPEGLLAQIELDDCSIVTDDSWLAEQDGSFVSYVPRISCQESFEEQYDARNYDGWLEPEYDDRSWTPAVKLRSFVDAIHNNMEHRGIPFLTMEPILPKCIVKAEAVRSVCFCHTISEKGIIAASDKSANRRLAHAYIATQVFSPVDTVIKAVWSMNISGSFKVNGALADNNVIPLKSGWNRLVASISGITHYTDHVVCFKGPDTLKFNCRGENGGSEWAIIGPFGLSSKDIEMANLDMDKSLIAINPPEEVYNCEVGMKLWEKGDIAYMVHEPYFHEVESVYLPEVNVFARAYTDEIAGKNVTITNEEGFVSGNNWVTVYPDSEGSDISILLDFGKEVVGFHSFEIAAAEGTIVDFHNFEFIQPDGRYNYAEGMNNSLRYVCREGIQAYQSFQRRGFRYSYMILRNMTVPVQVRNVKVLFSSYPQSRKGSFICSDHKLNNIWEVGAHTLRCCSEDTYTDCPTYEQTHWVGDARNEALIDWVVNGDPRLWYRCLEQTGDSLERSEITESNVPSGWVNLLPAWSFLWMRSCKEYYIYTGDSNKSMKLLEYVERNIDGIVRNIDSKGLFNIHAWSLFDWADMDIPSTDIVTHQNCFAVLALKDAAELAKMLGRHDLVVKWLDIAETVSASVNTYLWNDDKKAYTDCLRGGIQSRVFSQQTQTVAYMSGVAEGDRGMRCCDIIYNPPEDFVKAGSPFFEFFLLEAYQGEDRVQEFLDTIRNDWGFMVDKGSTTFWESWSVQSDDGRLTRSHCHGWSAAPTFFLSTYILGVKPGKAGFSTVLIEPHPGDLAWCRGSMPTCYGNIDVQWENNKNGLFKMRVTAPDEVKVSVCLPVEGEVIVNNRMLNIKDSKSWIKV